jgi:hypothetical protein
MSRFGATVKLTLLVPDPEPGVETLIQETEAAVVQAHADDALTARTPLPPAALKDCALPNEPGHTDVGAYDTLTFSPVAEAEFTVRLKLP